MKYGLQGTTIQLLNMELEPGETAYSESGRLVYMSDNVHMDAEPRIGIWAGVKRKLAGESFYIVSFTAGGGRGMVGLGPGFPGKIVPMNLKEGEELIAQKDAFLACEGSVVMDPSFTGKMSAGILGDDGMLLLKLRGPGQCFFSAGGDICQIPLAPGQRIRVDTGNLAMFDSTVAFSIERVPGVGSAVWGGGGLFLATCTGPGRVWVQSMPGPELSGRLAEYMPAGKRRGR